MVKEFVLLCILRGTFLALEPITLMQTSFADVVMQ